MADIFNSIEKLFKTVFESLGPNATLAIFGIGLLIWAISIWRKDKKEKTIQRLANESREQKVLIYKKIHNWSDERIENYVMKNVPPSPKDSRDNLENRN